MKNLLRAGAVALALLACAPLHAADVTGKPITAPSGSIPAQAMTYDDGTGNAKTVSATRPLPAADASNAAYAGEATMTVGTTYTARRSLKANCTATGNVSVTYSDGSTGTWVIAAAGTTVIPAAITAVNTAGTTATCTYANLK
jgi:hypothetical protein